MKIKVLFVLLIACSWTLSLNAQESTSFPITGTFKLQAESKSPDKDYNKVVITKDGYSVWMDDKVIRTYKLLSKTSEGYRVEQSFTGPGSDKKDKPQFTVRLDKENKNDCFITVIYGNRVEKVHLVKI